MNYKPKDVKPIGHTIVAVPERAIVSQTIQLSEVKTILPGVARVVSVSSMVDDVVGEGDIIFFNPQDATCTQINTTHGSEHSILLVDFSKIKAIIPKQ